MRIYIHFQSEILLKIQNSTAHYSRTQDNTVQANNKYNT